MDPTLWKADGWPMLVAVIVGPILALMAQRWLDRLREGSKRRLDLFRRLMARRATPVTQEFVDGLNLIDTEFAGRWPSHKRVRAAWKTYFDHTGDDHALKEDGPAWGRRLEDYKIDLLHEMSKAVGYNFDKVDIKRNVYYPKAATDLDSDQEQVRQGVVELLTGKRALNVIGWMEPGRQPLKVITGEAVPPPQPPAPAAPPAQQPLPDPAPSDPKK